MMLHTKYKCSMHRDFRQDDYESFFYSEIYFKCHMDHSALFGPIRNLAMSLGDAVLGNC